MGIELGWEAERGEAALAKQAGLPANLRMASGPELAQLPPEVFDQVAAETTVFGRIAPEQKEQIVASLIRQGHYVAMMGDGVNDALSLKRPNWASRWKAAAM